jgi:DNA-binding MarR family transcriptional regulator
MTVRPNEAAIDAWVQLTRAQQAVLAHIEKRLKAAGLPPLTWYDVLLELDRAGKEGGLRPFELERELLLPQYGLSRLLDRLESAGYVERRPCPDDGRGQIVTITKEGSHVRRRMWPVYAQAVDAAIARHLTEDEAAVLSRLLAKLRNASSG